MQRFGVLNFVGWVVEITGWIILIMGFVFAMIMLAGGAAAAANTRRGGWDAGTFAGAGILGIMTALGPIWVGLVTIAGGQTLRVLVVIARSTQETVLHLTHMKRRLGADHAVESGD